MLDPNRYSLDAATVGFRKRMGLSVNWGNFNEAIQVQTEAIKVRRELEETPISEIHVMGGQGLGIAGNGKTNELARQSRQMNGYPLRSFYATGGAVVVPQKHGEGLLATPMNLGLTQYAQYNGVVGNYVSSFTEPLNAPMDSNIMLLARTGAQLRNESISNPFKVLQFNLNMNSSLEQIRAIEQQHKELRGYNKEMLAKDLLAQNNSAYSNSIGAIEDLKRKRSGAAAEIGATATSQPGSGTGIMAGTQAPGVMTRPSKRTKSSQSAADKESILEYLTVLMPEEQAILEASSNQAQGTQDLTNNDYAEATTPSILDRIERFQSQLNTPTTPIRRVERPSRPKSGGQSFKPKITTEEQMSEEDKRAAATSLAGQYYGFTEEQIYNFIDMEGYSKAVKRLKADQNKALSGVETEARASQLEHNILANSLLNAELPSSEAIPLEKSDNLTLGQTGTFNNPVESASISTNRLMQKASETPQGFDISSGTPNSKPSAGFLNGPESDAPSLLTSQSSSNKKSTMSLEEFATNMRNREANRAEQIKAGIALQRSRLTPKNPQTPGSGMTTGENMTPLSRSGLLPPINNKSKVSPVQPKDLFGKK